MVLAIGQTSLIHFLTSFIKPPASLVKGRCWPCLLTSLSCIHSVSAQLGSIVSAPSKVPEPRGKNQMNVDPILWNYSLSEVYGISRVLRKVGRQCCDHFLMQELWNFS
jgi:hypothetical protein